MHDHIFIKDNSRKGISKETSDILLPYSNTSIEQLLKENDNLLVFPATGTKDKIEKLSIYSISDNTIHTGNLMGFVSVSDGNNNKVELSITSRFAQGDDDKQDFFLHYMLSRVLNINIVNLEHTASSNSLQDFLVYLFPRFLHDALSQGLISEYKWKQYNDSNITGVIDISRHIKYNIPFQGKIAHNNKIRTTDNDTTQLIRHTIEYIKQKYNHILSKKEVKDEVSQIIFATPSYFKNQRQRIISKNLRSHSHPYYTKYTPLKKICIAILMHDSLSYNNKGKQIQGILFDGAWLWEEYLNTLLRPLGVIHSENKEGTNPLYLFNTPKAAPRYPDFYIRKSKEDYIAILDAKYKKLNEKERKEEDSTDFDQMALYLYITKAEIAALLFPFKEDGNGNIQSVRTFNGYGGRLYSIGLMIPGACDNWKDFCDKISASENVFIDVLKNEILIGL